MKNDSLLLKWLIKESEKTFLELYFKMVLFNMTEIKKKLMRTKK